MLKELKINLLKRTKTKKIVLFLIADIILISFSCFFGFYLRFDGSIPREYQPTLLFLIFTVTPLTIFFFKLENLYSISLSFVSIKDLLRLMRAVTFSFFTLGIIFFILKELPVSKNFPRSVLFMSYLLIMSFTSILRFIKRIYHHGFNRNISKKDSRVLIFGAGNAGEQLIRHIMNSNICTLFPVGIIDDNPMKQGVSIHGIRVLGTRQEAKNIIQKNIIQTVIIAMPAASQQVIRETVDLCRQCNIKEIKILPSTQELLDGKVSLNHIRDVSIADLLGRSLISIETKTFNDFISNKKVLVTGAAGSIGSYLCKQILKFSPRQLIALDCNETGIFNLQNLLSSQAIETEKKFIIGNICDQDKINYVFANFKPDLIFHAAAYKHVHLMETHPEEAVKNNIIGTNIVCQAAVKYKAEKFILISTDKAINPSSIMGACKRIGEMITVWFNKQNSTKFCAVRFGNVLDSQGNVIEIFERQIKKGGPVEITHPDMSRYFMVTAEACLLVMQAASIGNGGEVFVLDMGKPIKIIDLAREMIRMSGYEPDVDIPIIFTGIRPGEKLFESILTDAEEPTKHEKIFISKLNDVDDETLLYCLSQFQEKLKTGNSIEIKNIIKKLVPTIQ